MEKKDYFAYFLPLKDISGVLRSWKECEALVKGEVGAKYKKFPTHQQALLYLEELLNISVPQESKTIKKNKKIVKEEGVQKETGVLYFDSGTGRNMGVEISVTNAFGESELALLSADKDIFSSPLSLWGSYIFPKEKGLTNNFGELFAFFCALKISEKKEITTIYGDSRLIIDFWSLGRMNSKNLAQETVSLILKVTQYRKVFEQKGGKVTFIQGKNNPADMGFHKPG